jgi:hypothetical protein
MKDIFIDAQIANKFAKPPSEDYKRLISWLYNNDKNNPKNNAILMISDKLLIEYKGGNQGCQSATSIVVIINKILIDSRYVKVKSNVINSFVSTKITKKIIKDVLLSNKKDWYHFPLVFNSFRKLALVEDKNFANDILNFPRFSKGVMVFPSPEGVNFEE